MFHLSMMENKIQIYLMLLLVEYMFNRNCVTHALSDQDNNVKAAYEKFRWDMAKSKEKSSMLRHNPTTVRREKYYGPNSSKTPDDHLKHWRVGRVTRKQYEMINMLWRKTKIFVNEGDLNATNPPKRRNMTKLISKTFKNDKPNSNLIMMTPTPTPQTTTPSKIEFYYLDDTYDYKKQSVCVEPNCKQNIKKIQNTEQVTQNPTFLVFHIKGPYVKPQSNTNVSKQPIVSRISPNEPLIIQRDQTPKKGLENKQDNSTEEHSFVSKFCTLNASLNLKRFNKSDDNLNINRNINEYNTESTTIYDKIKFFELYDKRTPTACTQNRHNVHNNERNEINNDQKILLEHVNQRSHSHNEAKHSKKHITEYFQELNKFCYEKGDNQNTQSTAEIVNVTLNKHINETLDIANKNLTASEPGESGPSYVNVNASWSEYPFVAVYIYEPSQVHCDAAGINAHWLVASGSCLSRVSKRLVRESRLRSAFVAYCGEQWWQPERVAYVKYSLVHPMYNPRDSAKRHLYNIGVIQVVSSMMAACTGWYPVSIMSHQFVPDPRGSEACAIGWGLDRLYTRYAADLTKNPVMIYKSLVYFNLCPGNVEYSKAKRLEENWLWNVHCLSLPPYSGESDDPVHGGLLLVGGKLIALYLQEVRRPWSDQSAQYTGIWRLIPWLMEVVREPDEMDSLLFDI